MSPDSGRAGDIVTVAGCDFGIIRSPDSHVSFGTLKATAYTSWTDKEIEVEVPAGVSGEVEVTVTVPQGTSNGKPFTAPLGPLAITSITPSQAGQFALVQQISVSGTGFEPGATLKLVGGTTSVLEAYNLSVSGMQINGTITLFGAEPGAYDVVVENPGGEKATLAGGFMVTSLCGAGSGGALFLLGITLGLLSLAGFARTKGRKGQKNSASRG